MTFLFFLAAGSVIVFSQNFAAASDAGTAFTVFFAENLTLIVLISLIFYVPSFWSKRKKHPFITALASTAILTLLLTAAGVFFPHSSTVFSLPDVEPGRFYKSGKNLLFVDNIEKGTLTGLIINKKTGPQTSSSSSSSSSSPVVYKGNYKIKENMKLKLSSVEGEYKLEAENPWNKFFNALIKYSSTISADISRGGFSSLSRKILKTISVIISVTAISIFFSSGSWPVINYMFSQFFVFLFILGNYHLQRIPLPLSAESLPGLFPDKTLSWYLLYLLMIGIITAAFFIKKITGVNRR